MSTTTPNEIALSIGSKRFRFWSTIDIGLTLDSYATCELTAPYEPDRREFRATFRPFSFQDMDVLRGGNPLFTGTLVGVEPEKHPNVKSVNASGYSKPGVLADCTLPADMPREFRKMSLHDIALAVTEQFGIDVVFRGDPGAPFAKQSIGRTQNVHDFLEGLAQQRNFVMSSTAAGELLFWKSITTGRPRARLKDGQHPVVSVKPAFNVQEYFSEVTGYADTRRKRSAKHTERNPWLTKFRPSAVSFQDIERGDLAEATQAEIGRMFGNVVSWRVDLPTWLDPQGDLWEPNTIITLDAPDAMIYRETELLIRRVGLHAEHERETATLDVVLIGAFSGETPSRLPWDE